MLTIELKCVGKVDEQVLEFLERELPEVIPCKVVRGGQEELPREAYNAKRRQYSSSAILERICERRNRNTLMLFVTEVDLYTHGLNFVFGEAIPATGCCIISLARLGYSFDGELIARAMLEERALKEAVHEIGHLLGLGHCHNPGCVMYFSNSIADTDRKSFVFCRKCGLRMSEVLR